jgi:hypothetical protein
MHHLIHLHARGVPVVPETDDNNAALLAQNGLQTKARWREVSRSAYLRGAGDAWSTAHPDVKCGSKYDIGDWDCLSGTSLEEKEMDIAQGSKLFCHKRT